MKLAVITTSRADYYLYEPILRELNPDNFFLIVTGSHLSDLHGQSWRDIEFPIYKKLYTMMEGDSCIEVVDSMALTMVNMGQMYEALDPDMVMVLGDRYEMFAAALPAFVLGIPICHLYGGDLTQHHMDQAWRDSLSSIATHHFTATNRSRDRLIQMGHNSRRIQTIGSIGLARAIEEELPSTAVLEGKYYLTKPVILVTYHPQTGEDSGELVDALEEYVTDFDIIWTHPNADPGHRKVQMLGMKFPSMGQKDYLGMMRDAAIVVGNSSSIIYESPAFGTRALLVGSRQLGREKDPWIESCMCKSTDIVITISDMLEKPAPGTLEETPVSIYSGPGPMEVVEWLKNWS